jgi:hypothetical protein
VRVSGVEGECAVAVRRTLKAAALKRAVKCTAMAEVDRTVKYGMVAGVHRSVKCSEHVRRRRAECSHGRVVADNGRRKVTRVVAVDD